MVRYQHVQLAIAAQVRGKDLAQMYDCGRWRQQKVVLYECSGAIPGQGMDRQRRRRAAIADRAYDIEEAVSVDIEKDRVLERVDACRRARLRRRRHDGEGHMADRRGI